MKTLRNTPDQLIIEHLPILWVIFITGFGLLLTGIGVFMITEVFWPGLALTLTGLLVGFALNAVISRRIQLIFDRPRNLVKWRCRSMTGFQERSWDLSDLERVDVHTSHSGDTPTHRAVLIIPRGMDAGTHPVTLAYTSGPAAQHCADTVNAWLGADS